MGQKLTANTVNTQKPYCGTKRTSALHKLHMLSCIMQRITKNNNIMYPTKNHTVKERAMHWRKRKKK